MDEDDLEPVRKSAPQKNLEPLSVAELAEYIDTLKAEIGRAERAIVAKQGIRAGADSLFRR